MQLGLMVEPQLGGSYERLLSLARWAERAGFEIFARSDHYLHDDLSAPATDAFSTLAGLARDTTSIQLVVLVTPLTFRHPAVIAKTAATIDEMSGGRMELGIGTGWMESEHEVFGMELHDLAERFDRFEEALAYVRAVFSGSGGYEGTRYALAPTAVLPEPTGPLPIIIGGSGVRRTPTLAGRFADEYNMFACERSVFEQRVAVMREAARAAGRDPDTIAVSIATNTIVAPTEAAFSELLAAGSAEQDLAPDRYRDLLRRQNIVHGTPEDAAADIQRLGDMGVDRVYLQEFCPLDDVDTAKLGAIAVATGR